MPDFEAEDARRIAVVTGAGRGLGQAFALGLAEGGHSVAGVARSVDRPWLND